MEVKIIDTTLREGRQSIFFENIFLLQDEYVEKCLRMGVFDFEYRNPSISLEELRNFRRIKDKFPKCNFHVHIFLNKKNIDWISKESSIELISTFVRFPLTETSRFDLNTLLDHPSKKIRLGIENSPATSDEELQEFSKIINNKLSVDRIAFSDTLGNFTPETIGIFFKKIKNLVNGKDLEFHLHNDFGLAAANAVEILQLTKDMPGTLYLSSSFFGTGERNGILSHGDLIANMIRLKFPHHLNLTVYGEILNLMEKNKIVFNRDPICSTSYYHFASSHILGEFKNQHYHNIPPEKLGIEQKLILNKSTGLEVFKHIAENILQQGVTDDGLEIKELFINLLNERKVSYLTIEEAVEHFRGQLNNT